MTPFAGSGQDGSGEGRRMTDADRTTDTAPETGVRDLIARLEAAAHARDGKAWEGCFTDAPVIFDLAPPLVVDPGGSIQEWFDGWDGPVVMTHRDLAMQVEGGLALVHGLVHTATERGGEPAAWWARCTYGLRHGDEGWRISHSHVSVPFYMDGSFRAAIDLEP